MRIPFRNVRVPKSGPSIQKLLEDGARVLWVAAHPDDESMAGPVLAKAGPGLGNPLFFLVLTHGEGGDCCIPGGCHPDLATVRGEEMKRVAEAYRAELRHERYWNAPLPVESFPLRHELAAKWNAQGDPTRIVAETIRRFRPDVVLTFHPDTGFTGHPEHQLTARLAGAGIRMAADAAIDVAGLPAHRASHLFYVLNRYFPFRWLGQGDEGLHTDVFDATQPCTGGKTCARVMADLTRFHRSQDGDMRQIRVLRHVIRRSLLLESDPFTEVKDPLEVQTERVPM
jgi:LmbE family N-acetylglucosaminyl deacetylase